jgi:2-polyprenyl-3-methyl-5-hydroxy-6-metoxy-1,4-benzoquinol methylase
MKKSSEDISIVTQGERFAFGRNWSQFQRDLDEHRIALAKQSLRDMLEVDDLRGLRFLDVGSASGLFSLAARRLGASVHSFDFDPQSVTCTCELKRHYFPPGQHVDH